ncbi:MAG: acetyl-CoA carboxylase biotin carboxyl carrier protein subunit [Deltaproteobacteria bacterium]|nr:acetyl-CoA carboxylase biotin carboxyl carrier protein subunit [Deltaproteobacteria bacterium]
MAFLVSLGGRPVCISVAHQDGSTYRVQVEGREQQLVDVAAADPQQLSLIIEGQVYEVGLRELEDGLEVTLGGHRFVVEVADERRAALRRREGTAAGGRQVIRAPMPGRVVRILVGLGEPVEAGQGVIVIEAMKMENELRARAPGEVREILVREGDTVEGNADLVVIE